MTNQLSTKDFFNSPAVVNRFTEVMGERSKQFVTSILSIANDNKLLANANPQSIMQAAMKAATLNLAIDPSLGFAYIVPYGQQAQFQLGYKGLIQLAIRSGQIKNINSGVIYENQFKSFDTLFEKLEVDFTVKGSGNVVGYFATLELVNGFKKLIYWDYDRVYTHGKRFSKSFARGPWKTDFDAMAQKTLLKALIGTYAPLSQEMEQAVVFDNETEDKTAHAVDVTPDSAPETLSDLIGATTPEVFVNHETGETIGADEQPEQQQISLGIEDF